ncbi:hypothetical protein AAG906_027192 [Vitis piasezkii]
MFSMCFPMRQYLDAAPHGPHTFFDMFGVFVLEIDKDDSIPDAYTDDVDFIGIGHILDAAPHRQIPPFSTTGPFSKTRLDFTLFQDCLIPPFSDTTDPSRYSPGFHHFPVLARTLLRYSPGFHHFPVLSRTLLRYSPGFHHFSVLARTLLRYSPGFHLLPRPDPSLELAGPFSKTRPDSTLSQDLPGPFSKTCPDFTLFLARIPPFSQNFFHRFNHLASGSAGSAGSLRILVLKGRNPGGSNAKRGMSIKGERIGEQRTLVILEREILSVGKLQHCGFFEEESDSLSVLEVIIGMHGSYLVEILRNFLTKFWIFTNLLDGLEPVQPVQHHSWLHLSAMRNTCLSLSGSHSSGSELRTAFVCFLNHLGTY